MPVYVALLRAVNLGGHNRVAMPALREALADAGCEEVSTHLQSGNAIFASAQRSSSAVERTVEKVMADSFGVEIEVVARTPGDLSEVVARNPFATGRTDPKSLYVAFLKRKPKAAAAAKLDAGRFDPERFELRGRELYLLYPNGYGRSKMTGAFFERTLGVPATVRNWNVTRALADLAQR